METADFLATVKTEVLAQEDDELPVIDFNPPRDVSPGYVVAPDLLDVPIAPVSVKVEQGTIDEEVTVWNVAIPHENTESITNLNAEEEDTLFIDENENESNRSDPDFQPGSDDESDDLTTYPDHDYTPMAGVDPSSMTHIEILDCHQDKNKGYNCPHCLYTTRRYHHFQSHIVCHSDEKPFQCNKCDFRTARKMALVTHSRYKHSNEKMKCEQCEFTTKHSSSLRSHMKLHSEEKKFSCPRCDFKTKHWISLKSHLVQHTDVKALKCQYCDFRTKHAASLRYHLKVHASERAFKCDECDFTATSASNLQQHKLRHTDVRPFPCELCGLKFKSTSMLKHHVKSVHLNVKPYKCKLCPKRFCSSGNLYRHQIVHGGPKKLFECPECHVEFTLESNLKRHQKKHENPVSYRCRLCQRTFTEPANLRRHINTVHLRAIQIMCPFCNKILTTSTSLRRHIKRLHPERWSDRDGKLEVNKLVKKSAVTKSSLVSSEAGLTESVIAEDEVENPGGRRRTVLPRNEAEHTIIEPEYDTELIDTLSRCNTSLEVKKKDKKSAAIQTKTLASSGEPTCKKRGRPPNRDRLRTVVKGKEKKTTLEIRKPYAFANRSKLGTGKLVRKSMQQSKAMEAKGKKKIGRPSKVQKSTVSSRKSGSAGAPVRRMKVKNVAPSKTSTGKKRGRPKKSEAETTEQEDGAEEDLSETIISPVATPIRKRGRPKMSAEAASSTGIAVKDSIETEESDTSVSNPSFTTLDQPVKKRRGRPPKNRPPETVSVPEGDIVLEADIPVGATCAEISAVGNFRKTAWRNSEREGLFAMMRPLTVDGQGASDEAVGQSEDNDYEETSAVECVPDADHLYAAPPLSSAAPAPHPAYSEQTPVDSDPALAVNNAETEQSLSVAPVQIRRAQSALDGLVQINRVLAKSSTVTEVELHVVAKPAQTETVGAEIVSSECHDQTEPLSSKSANPTPSEDPLPTAPTLREVHDEAELTPATHSEKEPCPVESDSTPESEVAPSNREISARVEHAVSTSTQLGGILVRDIEKARTSLDNEIGSEMGRVNGTEVVRMNGTVPEEQSSVMEYFGLQRKVTESEQHDLQMSASVNADVDELVGADESIITGTQQIESPQFTLGTMRETTPAPSKGFEGISGLLRQAMIRNKIRGRPWITGTAKDRQRYLQEKAQMASKKAKRGRPPKVRRPGRPQGSKKGIKQQPGHSETTGTPRLGRPKGSKNRMPINITDGLRKSGRQPKASQKMLEYYESSSGSLSNTGEKRDLSEKFQKMIDSLIGKADGSPEIDSDAAAANISGTEKKKLTVRKSKRALKLSAKKSAMIQEVEGLEETRNSGADSEDEDPPPKMARLTKVNKSPKRGKTSCLVFSARNAKEQKTGQSIRAGLVLKKKKRKLEKNDDVEMSGRRSPRGPGKTPRKERRDKGFKRGPLQSSLPRKERRDKGVSRGRQKGDGPRSVRRDKGILHGPLNLDKPRKERSDKGVKKGPRNSITPRKVRRDKGVTRKDQELQKEKQTTKKSLKQTSRQTPSAAGSSDQNFCMVPMKDFSMLLQNAGKVVYVLPADSHLGQIAAASNSVMCLVPQSDNVVIPPGAIPVQAVSNASASETEASESTDKRSEPETIESSEKVESDQVNPKPRKVRSDKGIPRKRFECQNSPVSSLHASYSECQSGTNSGEMDGSVVKTPRKVRSDKGVPRKLGRSDSETQSDLGPKENCFMKKPRKERSDKGVPRKLGKSPSQPHLQPVHAEADSQAHPGTDPVDEHSGIFLDPRECLSFNASSQKPRKVRSDKGVPKGPRKRSKGPYETDMGTVIKKKCGRPKMIQTSKDSIEASSIGESAAGVGNSSVVGLENVSGAKKVGRPRKFQKTFDGHKSPNDLPARFEGASIVNPESALTPQFSKRRRKPKVDEDFVNFEDAELHDSDSEQNPAKIHERTTKECSVPVEKVVKKRGRPPKDSCRDTSDESAAKWMKVTMARDGVVTPNSSGNGRGKGVKTLAAPALFSPNSITKSMTGHKKKHTARKSFPQPSKSLPPGTSQTSSLYSDIFPGGGIPVPVMDKNPVMSQLAHAGTKVQTSMISEADRAVMALAHSDPSVQEELVYVDVVMDPLGKSQQFAFLTSQTDGLPGTLVSGIEAQSQSVEYEIIDASHLQPLLDQSIHLASSLDCQ